MIDLTVVDEPGKMRVLRLVRGYLEVLGSRVVQFTCSLPHLSRLTQALLQVHLYLSITLYCMHTIVLLDPLQTVKLDPSDGCVAETRGGNLQLQEEEDNSWSLPLAFVHIRGEAVEREVYEICRLLGRQGDAPVLLDHLLEHCRSTALRAESFILLRHVLDGVALRTSLQQDVISVIQVVVEEVSGEEFDLSQEKILQNCLLMRVLAGCADVLSE